MLVGFLQTAWSTDLIAKDNDIFYYKFQTLIPLPDQFTKIVKPLYFNTYDPVLHEGYSLEEMKIDPHFNTYEEFLHELIDEDFKLYSMNADRVIFFATQQLCRKNYENICGFCVFIPQAEKGEYYLDHIGVKVTHKRQGIGHQLLALAMNSIEAKVVTLDTRIFNRQGKNFYEKEGFSMVSPHPISTKEGAYLRYIKNL
jgi:ribosomal protein S18 acetylase RimI-like enzyme